MYTIKQSKQFKKSLKRLVGSGNFKKDEVLVVVEVLASGQKLDESYRDHALKGNLAGFRECHIRSNLLLIYEIKEDMLLLFLLDIGTHAEILGR